MHRLLANAVRATIPNAIRKAAKRGLLAAIGLREDVRVKTMVVNPEGQPWTVVLDALSSESIVYSLGLGDDISFDLGIVQKTGAQVFGFDPTPGVIESLTWNPLPDRLKLLPRLIGARDCSVEYYALYSPLGEIEYLYASHPDRIPLDCELRAIEIEMTSVPTIMKELGHARIDLLKVDIEGAEIELLQEIAGSSLNIPQIAVELHYRFPQVGFSRVRDTVRALRSSGYRIAHVSEWGEEFLFVRQDILRIDDSQSNSGWLL